MHFVINAAAIAECTYCIVAGNSVFPGWAPKLNAQIMAAKPETQEANGDSSTKSCESVPISWAPLFLLAEQAESDSACLHPTKPMG